ncbi:MAG: cobalt-precorrin-5B (C(1))-methyltransferase [Bilophila wadsworthia]
MKSHHIAHGTTMVFCTGGRTKSGAERRLPSLPETAFTCIGDFIAESLAAACEYGMREIVVACMAGKLCKYAAGFENTHAHKVSQDMDLLRAEVRKHLPGEEALHDALATAFPCGKRFCPSPKRIGPASYDASPAPPSGSLPAVAGKTSCCGCSSSILRGNFYLRKNGVSKRNRRKTEKFFRDKATPPMPPLLPQKLQRQGAGSTRNLNTTERSA